MMTLLCAVFSSAAAQETFIFANMGYENAQELTEIKGENVTLTFDKGTGSTTPKYYNSGTNARFYGGNTLTIASAKDIASVEFTCSTGYDIYAEASFSTGTVSGNTWTGPAKEVTLTNGGKTQIRFTAITVNFSDGTVSKTNPGLKVDDVTLTEGTKAALNISTLSDGALTFTSSNTAVATVAAAGSGYEVSGIAQGNATITVRQAETAKYTAAETTFEVKVNPYVAPGTYATVSAPYSVDFTKTQDLFVIEDIDNELGTPIWTQSSSYGMVATSYVQLAGDEKKTNHDGESWLVSPIIDLSSATAATLTFPDNWNGYFGDYTSDLGVFVHEVGGRWQRLDITYEKPSNGFHGWQDEVIDLSAYAGKKVQVGFYYCGSSTTAGTYEVRSFSVTTEATVIKKEADLSYDVKNFTATIGEDNAFPVLNNPNGLTVTYTSSNTDVATIDAQGNITLVAKGSTTIKANFEENDYFKAGSADYQLVVKEKAIPGTDVYQPVTDAASLAAGDQIIIVNEENNFALSTTQNTANRAAADVVLESNGTIIPSNQVQPITLEQGEDGKWFLSVGNGYLYAASTTANQLKTQSTADEKAAATITIDGEGIATVLFNQWADNARTLMRYNPNSGNPIFSCYAATATTGTALRIYRNTNAQPPKAPAGLAYSATEYTATIGQQNTFPTLDNPNKLTVTYTSSNEEVATINASGAVSLVGEGTTVITASSAETDAFKAGTASYTLKVETLKADNSDLFALVADFATLAAGDEIIFVGENTVTDEEENSTTSYYGLGTNQKANNREAVAVTHNADGTISGNNKLQTITLEGDKDGWYFNVGNGYLYAASNEKNYLRTETEADDNAKAIISKIETETEEGVISSTSIVFQGENSRNVLQFNAGNATNMLFSCYATASQKEVKVYRKTVSDYHRGDANGDGEVDVADAMACVYVVLNQTPKKFIFENADIDNNNTIDIADVMGIVAIILKTE